jgi:hypothetical protein
MELNAIVLVGGSDDSLAGFGRLGSTKTRKGKQRHGKQKNVRQGFHGPT